MSFRCVQILLVTTAGAILATPAQAQLTVRPSVEQIEPIRVTPDLRTRVIPTEIVPPSDVLPYDDPDSVTLKPGPSSVVIQSLGPRRSFSVTELQSNPTVRLHGLELDMRPVLQNPNSLINTAVRLRERPDLAEVISENVEVIEVTQGLVIRQFLAYRLKPGACTDRSRRVLLDQAGSHCFVRMTDQQRRAGTGANRLPSREEISQREQEQAQIAADIAQLRSMLRDPAQRLEIVREIGEAQAARFSRLTDAELEAELVNLTEIEMEEIMFVPTIERARPQFTLRPGLQIVGQNPVQAARLRMPEFAEQVNAEHQVEDRIFLTGFTVGNSDEWRKRVKTTISWCVVGCKKTYYVELNANFHYDFGLRLPIAMGGTYRYDGQNQRASFVADFAPVNGSEFDFQSTLLPSEMVLDGQELVAEVSAGAGLSWKVPVAGSGSVGASIGTDFTDGLPSPFTNGQFTPPAPGAASPASAEKVFTNIDLLGGRANFWFVGATIHPSVKLALNSDTLQFRLHDNLRNSDMQVTHNGQQFDLGVDSASRASSFTIGDPLYNLGFEITPGITANFFVDVKLWRKDWPIDVWFPQLTVTLPPGGIDFGCHEQTICSRSYYYSPNVAQQQDASPSLPSDPMLAKIVQWQRNFDATWIPECPEEEIKWCEVAIRGVPQRYGNLMAEQITTLAGEPVAEAEMVSAPVVELFDHLAYLARSEASLIIIDSFLRQNEDAEN